jgi:seryl-tRNA synthetase
VSEVSEDKVHRIVNDRVSEEVEKLEASSRSVERSMNVVSNKVVELSTKMDAIYGNGSGRDGILDEMKKEQKSLRHKLEEEIGSQDNFRRDIRSQFETMQTLEASKLKVHAERKDWVKWVAGGIGVLVWKLLEIYIFPHLGKH